MNAIAFVPVDPPVPDDGLCVVCSKPRKITRESRKYAGDQIDDDPFCSTGCCRSWHGCELAGGRDDAEGGDAA